MKINIYEETMCGEHTTLQRGLEIGRLLKAGDIIYIEGDLGAGKTTFTKGIARGLDIEERITSPTFTIVKVYEEGRLPLYHLDVYRVSDDDFGLEDYVAGDGVTIVEWASQLEHVLPVEALYIHITYEDEGSRKYRFIGKGDRFSAIVEELEK